MKPKVILSKENWLLLNQIIFRNLKQVDDKKFKDEVFEIVVQHKNNQFNYEKFKYFNRADIGKFIMLMNNMMTNDYNDFIHLVDKLVIYNRKDILNGKS